MGMGKGDSRHLTALLTKQFGLCQDVAIRRQFSVSIATEGSDATDAGPYDCVHYPVRLYARPSGDRNHLRSDCGASHVRTYSQSAFMSDNMAGTQNL